jgi:hypothetical protein
MSTWRTQPPTPEEIADPKIIGWAFRGLFVLVENGQAYSTSDDPELAQGIIFPSPALRRRDLNLSGEWCPIYAPEEIQNHE